MTEPAYQIDHPHRQLHRRHYRRRILPLLLLLFIILVTGIIFWRNLSRQNRAEHAVIGATSHRTIAGPQTFRSTYFQFSDTATWEYDKRDSTPTKFIYLSYVGGLPAHLVTVYVNQVPPDGDLATTRVLPVTIRGGNAFDVGKVSDLCNTQYMAGAPKLIRLVSISGTNMLCVPDSPQYTLAVGQVGGDYHLTLRRQDGQAAQYIILYHNLTVTPSPTDFLRIMKTFQAL